MKKLPLKNREAYLFEDRLNRKYLTGADVAEGCFIYSEESVYFTDLRYYSAAKEKFAKVGVNCKPLYSDEDIKNELKAQKIKTLYIDFNAVTVARYNKLKTYCKNIKNGSAAVSSLRTIKTEEELLFIQKACEIAGQAVKDTFSNLKKGVTEAEVKTYLENRMNELGAEGPSFDSIVAFGKNSAVPHHETGDTKLTENTAVLIDTGCLIKGYCSDITRMAFFGTPDEEFLRAYDAVLTANLTAEEKIYGGISGVQADKFARDVLEERGYGKYFTHSLGHGVGLEIHELPNLSPKRNAPLEENSVFTVEPGVYIDGKFGIRIEDTCHMKNGKAVRFFKDDKSLYIVNLK